MKIVLILSAIVLLALTVSYFRKPESKAEPQSDANMIISDEKSRKAQPSQVPSEMATWIKKTFGEGSETIVDG